MEHSKLLIIPDYVCWLP